MRTATLQRAACVRRPCGRGAPRCALPARTVTRRVAPCRAVRTRAAQQPPPSLPPAGVLVGGSTVLYAGLAAAAAGLAHAGGAPPVLPALFAPPPLPATLGFTLPLLASLAAALWGIAAGVPSCVEIKAFMDRGITPLLRVMPPTALALLAAGAGLGEEAMFRGALLPLVFAAALRAGAESGVAMAVALGSTSVVFGALHAVTPLYFVWATAAGALFGWEYYATGSLSACAATHALYDLIAFIAVANTTLPPGAAGGSAGAPAADAVPAGAAEANGEAAGAKKGDAEAQ